ncbi:hypothetical protein Ctob_008839 [Chrysochromulina tobinii]|uniref:PDZ domain-containing protein n=1 Tax=Chrysochromulina tobinii TaxID=1460289 RepID=A0A0M0KDM6_9EUKA|nr:hypothetical protein Ctob_008839 [Chrysochromulina tobinii]|eukprot:KOO36697.1 hypothetical protein Ctob_008839 [Chrysochromulina sp. CCMP291]
MEDEFCFSDGPLGLVIAKDRDRHVVCCVVRNSQAAALGVQCGSVLLRIAGQDKAPSDFDSLDIMDVNRQLEQMRRPLTLRLRRPGENWSPNTTARLASARLEEERKLAVSISKAAESGRVRSIKFGEGPLGISLQQLGDAVLVLSVDAHSQAAELKTPLGVIVGINGNSVWGRSKTEVSMTIAQSSRPMTMQIRSAADETLEEPTVPDPAFARVAANIFAAEKAAEKAAEMRALVEASAIECSNEARAVAEKAMAQAKMLRRESASSAPSPNTAPDAPSMHAKTERCVERHVMDVEAQPLEASPAVVHEALNPARAREALMKTFGPRAQDGAKPSDGAQYGARSGAQYGAMAARGTTAANGASAQYGARFGAHNGAATTANGVASAAAAVPVARLPRPPSTHAPAALPLLSSEAAAIACAGAEAAAQAAAKARAARAVRATPPAQGAAGDGAGDGAGEGAGGEAPNMAPNDAAAAHDAAAADARDDAEEAAVTPSQIVPAAGGLELGCPKWRS